MERKQPNVPKKWHPQQEKILKSWGESSSCYRYLHFQSYLKYKQMNMKFTLPIIVISTITGTANFAQETFPVSWQQYVPLGIGGLNLMAAIATTVLQFLKANELMEAHRVASVAYGKLSRDIKLELGLPILDRKMNGSDLINRCSSDYDRLIEQSPPIPGDILDQFTKQYKGIDNIDKPEIVDIKPINLFDQLAETKLIKSVKNMFNKKVNAAKPDPPVVARDEHRISIYKSSDDEFGKSQQRRIASELEMLKSKNLVSVGPKENQTDDEAVDDVIEEISVKMEDSGKE
jgi:hypothetical protein